MEKRTVKNPGRKTGEAKAISVTVKAPDPTWHKGLDFEIRASDFFARAKIDLRESVPGKKEGEMVSRDVNICGWLAVTEVTRAGEYRVKRHWVGNKQDLQDIRSTVKYARGKLLEAMPLAAIRRQGYVKAQEAYDYSETFAIGAYSAVGGSAIRPNDEYHPLMAGPFNKQMYLYDYLDMHSKAFDLLNHNPLARQGANVITNYVCGKGVTVIFRNVECQDYWDEFEERNSFQPFLRTDNDTLTWAGEIFTQKVIEGEEPWIRHIDPSTIWDIITVPADITKVLYYHQQYPTQYQMVYRPTDVASEYIINDIPPEEMIHVKINAVPGEKRGRSDFLPVMGDMKRFRDYYDAKVLKAQAAASFAIRKKIKGSDADVQALANDNDLNAMPPPMSVIFENEGVETDFLEAGAEARATDNVGEALRSIIATGLGLSPEMLGVGGAASVQATAITKAEPAYMKFNTRQMILERYVRQIAEWVVQVGIALNKVPATQVRKASLGNIKAALVRLDLAEVVREAWALLRNRDIVEPIDTTFDVIFPEILTEDRTEKLTHVQNAAALGAFTHRRMSEVYAQELNQRNYDYDAEQEELEEEGRKQSMALYQRTAPSFVTPGGGQGPKPGDQAPGSTEQRGAIKDRNKEPK